MPARLAPLALASLALGCGAGPASRASPAAPAAPAAPASPASPLRVTALPPPELRPGGGAPAAPAVTLDEARAILPGASRACADIECLLTSAYAADPAARALALALYRAGGDVAGVGPAEVMDGGYRGRIRLVPELPVGRHRRHLAWVADALRSFDATFAALYAGAPTGPAFRWRGLKLRFVRSVGVRTPSAYALGFTIAYNVEGSLLTSSEGVRETLLHELFHANDGAHGDWSARALRRDYDAIVARCLRPPAAPRGRTPAEVRAANACLAPYAPNGTVVRGGLYYAFQQDNGDPVHEYGAELAVRYWKEQREMLAARRLSRPAFKCGPPENARAWRALVNDLFGGRDLTPPC